ncbi:MAG TPA: DinB family protein [Herpetosiphonaceae bacterium]
MQDDGFRLDETVAMLDRTPARLRALIEAVPERWVRATEGDGTWSPYDVIAHLIVGERTNWIVRARHILAGEQRPFPPFDRTPHAAESQGTSVDELLTRFAELRRANVAALVGMNLTHADLLRTGQHPEFGEVRLGQLLATWVVHDLNHVGQIVQTMAKVYAEAVGPWRAYLPIVQDRE